LNLRPLLLSVLLVVLGGCASEPPPKPRFVESASQTLAPPPPDQAQIVFVEPINAIQGLIPVGIFEVDGDKRSLLATTGAHSKAVVLFKPGHHLLMATQPGVGHYLDVNVEAGKRYYVLVRFIYANGFQLRPLRPAGSSDYTVQNKAFANWLAETRFVDKTPASDEYFERWKDRVAESQADGWKTWLAKTPQERAELTLNPEDAVSR